MFLLSSCQIQRVLWAGEQTLLSCSGLCVSTFIHISSNPLCVCMFACMRSGLGNRWRLGASSADTGVEHPAMELRLQGERAADDWGPGWRTDVMEPASSWTSLSPAVCGSYCLSVAPNIEPPAYLGLPVCLYALCNCCPESLKGLFFNVTISPPFLSLLNQSGYGLVVCPLLFFYFIPPSLSICVAPSLRLSPRSSRPFLSKQSQSQKNHRTQLQSEALSCNTQQ